MARQPDLLTLKASTVLWTQSAVTTTSNLKFNNICMHAAIDRLIFIPVYFFEQVLIHKFDSHNHIQGNSKVSERVREGGMERINVEIK